MASAAQWAEQCGDDRSKQKSSRDYESRFDKEDDRRDEQDDRNDKAQHGQPPCCALVVLV
jgi:hypothetical protein